jgi:CspA family cold shock protein
MNTRQTGTVKYSDAAKGFGYIARANQPDLFFLHGDILGDSPAAPKKGDTVTFDEVKGQRGPRAVQICNTADPQSMAAFEAWMTPQRQAARNDHAATQKRFEDYFKQGRDRFHAKRFGK